MKKLFLFFSLFSLVLITSSCDKDDNVSAFAKIEVKQGGVAQSGVTVYMFTEQTGPTSSFFKPLHSSKSVVTESNGIATFELQETFDLNTIDTQTTLYFGVFGQNDIVLGSTALTIKEGETKAVTINI